MCDKAQKFKLNLQKLTAIGLLLLPGVSFGQESTPVLTTVLPMAKTEKVSATPKYLDQNDGKTVEEMVVLALQNNGELLALRQEAQAAQSLIKQAGLRPNPGLEVSGTRQTSGSDNSLMVQGEIPLELNGRRGARVRVAEREADIRRLAVNERERQLAAEVRAKFGEALAAAFKLKFTEEMIDVARQNYNIVTATVVEGRRPPLEQNVENVELNRLRAMRETSEGAVEIQMLELRNLAGLAPEGPLKLRGTFENLLDYLPPKNEAIETALRARPDLLGARAIERLAVAKIEQARTEGKFDADVMVGYQRMRSGFMLSGIDEMGGLQPIENRMNFFTFGVKLSLPVRNRNQGMIEAALAEETAARRRREFGELTIRREVTAAYVRYQSAARAMEIYRAGVREQAAANLSVVRQTYEFGSKPLFDYIAEQRRFIETESGFIDAQLETYLARVEILRVTNAAELQK
jgi:cobalt-zinc-cadmium efflux system outer membrane protein